MICLKLYLKAKNTFWWFPELPKVSGGVPCWTDMDCIERVKVGMAKIEKLPKLAQNKLKRCFQSESHYSSPTLDFKPHLLNPFDMEHGEKTAVKFSILRVVML